MGEKKKITKRLCERVSGPQKADTIRKKKAMAHAAVHVEPVRSDD